MDLTAIDKRISFSTNPMPYKNARIALCAGGASSVLASICCLGPFLLVTLGFSSAKILYFMTLADWSRPFFILLALAALLFSYNSIWGSTSAHTAKGGLYEPERNNDLQMLFLIRCFAGGDRAYAPLLCSKYRLNCIEVVFDRMADEGLHLYIRF